MKVAQKYLQSREDALSVLLDKPRSKYTSGTFHLLRVELKKLSALFELLGYCSDKFSRKKINKPFKVIFRQAGRVRELQLEEALLKKYQINNSLSDYLTGLRNRRLNATDLYFTMLNEEMKHRLKKRFGKISHSLSRVKNKKVLKYLKQKTNNIKRLIKNGTLEPEQLHELRIQLKMLNYNRKSLSIEQSPARTTDVLPGLLGKWHDLEVMSAHLQKTITAGNIKRKDLVQLQKIIAQMSAQSQILLEKIIKAIPQSEFFSEKARLG